MHENCIIVLPVNNSRVWCDGFLGCMTHYVCFDTAYVSGLIVMLLVCHGDCSIKFSPIHFWQSLRLLSRLDSVPELFLEL